MKIKKIKKVASNRFICLKVDCAKWLPRAIAGVNIQCIEDGKIQLRTSAAVELKEPQTGLALKRLTEQVLGGFSFQVNKLYTAKKDNGANVLLTNRLIPGEQKKTIEIIKADDVDSEGNSFLGSNFKVHIAFYQEYF